MPWVGARDGAARRQDSLEASLEAGAWAGPMAGCGAWDVGCGAEVRPGGWVEG